MRLRLHDAAVLPTPPFSPVMQAKLLLHRAQPLPSQPTAHVPSPDTSAEGAAGGEGRGGGRGFGEAGGDAACAGAAFQITRQHRQSGRHAHWGLGGCMLSRQVLLYGPHLALILRG